MAALSYPLNQRIFDYVWYYTHARRIVSHHFSGISRNFREIPVTMARNYEKKFYQRGDEILGKAYTYSGTAVTSWYVVELKKKNQHPPLAGPDRGWTSCVKNIAS